MITQARAVDISSEAMDAPGNGQAGHNAKVRFEIEKITPEDARRYLETRSDGYDPNRKKSVNEQKSIAGYAEAMRAGGWIMNGMPIIFDQDGHLVDGYHRLEACILAETPFDTLVARNVQSDTLHTIDQHRRRSYSGVLESRGIRNAGSVLRSMTRLIRIENGILGKQNLPISWSRYDRVLSANPEIVEAVNWADDMRGVRLHSTPRPVLIFMAIKAGLRTEMREFLKALYDPEAFEPTHPASILANQMDTIRGEGVNIDLDKALAVSILAFNDFVEGKPRRKSYQWEPYFGESRVQKGVPTSWKLVRETAPDNLGLPRVKGYPGLEDGVFDTRSDADEFAGRLADSIREGIRTDKGNERVETRLVTPKMAEEWLQKFNTENRKIQRRHIEMIVRDIKDGAWMVNAQPICFTGDPDTAEEGDNVRLLNGQHRLEACKIAEIPIEIPIAKNIPEAAFSTYDIHAKRNVSRTASKADARVLNAAAKIQWKVDMGYPSTYRISPSATELLRTIERHPGLEECFSQARRMKDFASAGVMTYLIYKVLNEHEEVGKKFLEDLETGESLERGNPVIHARSVAIGQRKERNRKETLEDLEEAWSKYKKYKGIEKKKGNPYMRQPAVRQDELF